MRKITLQVILLLLSLSVTLSAAQKKEIKPVFTLLQALPVDLSSQKEKTKWAVAFFDTYFRFRLEPLKEISAAPHDSIYKYIPTLASFSPATENIYYTTAKKTGCAHVLVSKFEITKNKTVMMSLDIISVQTKTSLVSLDREFSIDQIPENLDSMLLKIFPLIKCPLSPLSTRFFQIKIAGPNIKSIKQLGEIIYDEKSMNHPPLSKSISDYEKCVQKDPTLLIAHYPLSEACVKTGQYEKAAKYLKELLDLAPIHYELFIMLSDAYRNCNKQNEAYAIVAKFDAMGLSSIPYLFEKAKVFEALKQNTNAYKIYYQILQKNPKHQEGLLFCARFYNSDAKYSSALPFADALIKIDSLNGSGYFERGKSLLGLGKVDIACKALQKSIALKPNDPLSEEYLGDALVKINNHTDAIICYKKAMQMSSKKITLLFKTSKAFENANNPKEALSVLKNNAAGYPEDPQLKKNIGILEFVNKNYADAIEPLNKYLQSNPKDYLVLNTLGNAYEKIGQFELALSTFQKALPFSNDKISCSMSIARILILKKDAVSAQKVIKDILAQRQIKGAYSLMGDALLLSSNSKDALKNYLKERELHGSDRFIQEKIAQLQYSNGAFTQSSLEYKRLLQSYPEHKDARYFVAIVMLKEGNFDGAENLLQEAPAYGNGTAEILYSLGNEFYLKKKFKKSAEYYSKTIVLVPNHEEAVRKCALSEINVGNESAGANRYIQLFAINNTKYSNLLAEAGHLFFMNGQNVNATAAYMLFLSKGFIDPVVNARYAEIEYVNKNYLLVCSLLKNVNSSNTNDKKSLLILSDSRSQTGDYKGAIPLLTTILSTEKDNKFALKLAAVSFEKTNELKKAISFYERYLTLPRDKDFSSISFHLGQLYESSQMFDNAINRYELTRKLYPEDLRIHERLGDIYMNKSMWKQAQDVLETALQSPEAQPLFTKMLAQTLASRNLFDKAILMYRSYLEKNATDTGAWKELGKIFFTRQNNAEAIVTLSKAHQLAPADFEINFLLGKTYIESGDYKKAIISLGHARNKKPNDLSIIELDARCYRNLNETSSLTTLLKEWIVLDPKRYDIKVELGSIYLNAHDIEKALSYLNDAVTFLPSEFRPHLLLAQAFELKGNDSLRLIHLEKAAIISNSNWELSYQYARYYVSKNKFDEAENYFNKVLEQKPEHGQSHYELALILNEKGNTARALAEIKLAIKYDNSNPLFYSVISYLYSLNNMQRNALSAIDTALHIGSQDPNMYYWISQTYRLCNKKDLAFKNINKALQIDKDYAKGYEALGDLYLESYKFKDASSNYFISWEKGGYNLTRALKLGNALTYNLQYNEAKGFYESILNHKDPSGEAVYRTIYAYCKLGDLKNARRIQKYFKKDDAPWIQLAQGILYETDNNSESAVTAYTIAAKIAPDNPLVFSGFGRIYAQRNQPDSSIANFQRALKDSLNMQSFIDLAIVFQEKGATDSALTYFDIVNERFPEHPMVQIYIASLQSQLNNHAASVAVLKRGIKYHPNDPMIHFLLGQGLETTGSFEEAISEYQVSLKIGNGQPKEALRNIGNIYFQNLTNNKKAKEYYKKYVKSGGNKNDIADAMKELEKI